MQGPLGPLSGEEYTEARAELAEMNRNEHLSDLEQVLEEGFDEKALQEEARRARAEREFGRTGFNRSRRGN